MSNTLTREATNEVVASIPFTFGYRPTRSIVLMAVSPTSATSLTIGACARLDLDVFEGGNSADQTERIVAALRRSGGEVTFAVVFADDAPTAAQFGAWVDMVAAQVDPDGFYGVAVVAGERIHAFDADCNAQGDWDVLELGFTKMSMGHGPRDFVAKPADYKFIRVTSGANAARFAAAGTATPSREASTAAFLRAVDGKPITLVERAGILAALARPLFRDGLIGWAMGFGTTDNFADFDPTTEFGGRPDEARLEATWRALGTVARYAPAGCAAPAIAVAAYLGWYAGDGSRARVWTVQALEEDEHYSLARLVEGALQQGCPPPWFVLAGSESGAF